MLKYLVVLNSNYSSVIREKIITHYITTYLVFCPTADRTIYFTSFYFTCLIMIQLLFQDCSRCEIFPLVLLFFRSFSFVKVFGNFLFKIYRTNQQQELLYTSDFLQVLLIIVLICLTRFYWRFFYSILLDILFLGIFRYRIGNLVVILAISFSVLSA